MKLNNRKSNQMCDKCIKVAENLNPVMIKFMDTMKPFYDEFFDKVGQELEKISPIDFSKEFTEQEKKLIIRNHAACALLGWNLVIDASDRFETISDIPKYMDVFAESVNNAGAMNFYRNRVKH